MFLDTRLQTIKLKTCEPNLKVRLAHSEQESTIRSSKKSSPKSPKVPRGSRLTAQQEAFALLVANGTGQTQAYRSVYAVDVDSAHARTHWVESSRLAKQQNVAKRIDEIRADRLRTGLLDEQSVLSMLLAEATDLRRIGSTGSSRVAAINSISSLLGLATKRVEIDGTVDVTHESLVELSADELIALKSAIRQSRERRSIPARLSVDSDHTAL